MPVPATALPSLQAVELFSSLQGEGLWLGARQVFFRLTLCNLQCAYCDTDFSIADNCRLETDPGCGNFTLTSNPVTASDILARLDQWLAQYPDLHQALNLTGGEPLCQSEALVEWLPGLRKRLPIHLETNGTMPDKLLPLLPWIDFISMDIKLQSATGQPTPWDEHRACLDCSGHIPAQAKCVVSQETPVIEVEQACNLLAEIAPQTPLILQPLTQNDRPVVSGQQLMAFQLAASRLYPHVRIIPQVHPLLNIL